MVPGSTPKENEAQLLDYLQRLDLWARDAWARCAVTP